MCKYCYKNFNDTEIIKMLDENLRKKEFDTWNLTSIASIRFAAMGGNGSIAQEKARQLFVMFIDYYGQSARYKENRNDILERLLVEIDQFRVESVNKGWSQQQIREMILVSDAKY